MECRTERRDEFVADLRECMELSVEFKVPIRADFKLVDCWGDAKE